MVGKIKVKALEGSITLELSLLFPIIFFSVMSIIYMIFYVSDIINIRSMLQQYAISESMIYKTQENIKNDLYSRLNGEMFIVNITDIDVNKNDNITNVDVGVNMEGNFFGIFMQDRIKTDVYNESNRQYIVRIKALIDTIEVIGG